MAEKMIFLKPQLKKRIWGGRRLLTEYPYQLTDMRQKVSDGSFSEADAGHIGECWNISAHPNGDLQIVGGTYAGMTLEELYREHRELFGNLAYEEFPLLVKFIDAAQDLSIQVHPDDAYARRKEHCPFGKMECWYILDCPKDAELIIGNRAKDKAELEQLIREGRYEELVREVPVKKGDLIQIEPGTIHTIKSGFLVLEIQQSSDITYRVYDYDRLENGKPRKLHIEQSIEVIHAPDKPFYGGVHLKDAQKNQMNEMVTCQYYKVWNAKIDGSMEIKNEWPFLTVTVISGEGTIDGKPLKKGDGLVLLSTCENAVFQGKMELVLACV